MCIAHVKIYVYCVCRDSHTQTHAQSRTLTHKQAYTDTRAFGARTHTLSLTHQQDQAAAFSIHRGTADQAVARSMPRVTGALRMEPPPASLETPVTGAS
jgi:hypothetical protein